MNYNFKSKEMQTVLESLKLDAEDTDLKNEENISENVVKCILCDEQFDLNSQELFLKHLFELHRLVIADVQLIADLKGYVSYWKHRFSDNKIEEFCTTMLVDKKPDGTPSNNEKYYLLSDVILEDKTLRMELQQNRLEKVLEQHRKERTDLSFCHECWFCHLKYQGARLGFFKHLSEAHNLQLGVPEKLVYTSQLLDVLEDKLHKLQCIYCEKIFKDRSVLKEHMRKKGHKRINPDDNNYDKYYLINYLEMGKNWHNLQKRTNIRLDSKKRSGKETKSTYYDESDDSSDSDWSEWDEKIKINIHCLFCNEAKTDFDIVLEHMIEKHNFDFLKFTNELTFYDKIRLVNYIRRQMYLQNCIVCGIHLDTIDNLYKHMASSKHCQMPPNQNEWNQVEYFFPTYEDDLFLCFLDDCKNDYSELQENNTVL